MADVNVSVGVTQTEYVIDNTTFQGEGNSTLNITIPSTQQWKNQYTNRPIPNLLIASQGELLDGDQIAVNITDTIGNTVFQGTIRITPVVLTLSNIYVNCVCPLSDDLLWLRFNLSPSTIPS